MVLIGVVSPKHGEPGFAMPYPAYEEFRDHNQVFSSVLAYADTDLTARFGDTADRVRSRSTCRCRPLWGRIVWRPRFTHSAPVSRSVTTRSSTAPLGSREANVGPRKTSLGGREAGNQRRQ